ncbi:N-acyl homoserine lactonase family protein [Kushneria sp. Sum13]|uniref:N-acyl homoserine lactonase family protein n=1 Tax=Kushneria sp. Sum13 TaxID=3459196 RepID=UPI0040453DBF
MSNQSIEKYEVFAIKYAEHRRTAGSNFMGGDPHDGPMPMDYFIWVVRNSSGAWVIDTGFNAETATKRGRDLIRCPGASLSMIGIDAATVRDVIVSHLHYDHIGNFDLFPAARYHLQDIEMQFATGRHMAHKCAHEAYNLEDVVGMVRQVYKGRVAFHDGDAELAPGLSVHLVGGHTMGLQVVRVFTQRGWVVLASDASHYYRNFIENRPFPIVFNVEDMITGWGRMRELADSDDHIIPGHDPQVLLKYPAPHPRLQGMVCELHVNPDSRYP